MRTVPILMAAASLWLSGPLRLSASDRIDFNRQIRPLLSETCSRCHGPDQAQRKAGLRLDVAESAYAPRPESLPAITPGQPGQSEVWLRVSSSDEAVQMPPPESGLTLKPADRDLLKQWIEQGAEYRRHWAFLPPERTAAAAPFDASDQGRDPLDLWIAQRLEREQLPAAPPADRATLLRRVTLDLTGLPPSIADLDDFLADERPEAYERVVDRLLASPRYGEHLAVDWLDAARFADTNGYFSDFDRPLWPWRDWVIRALNANMPFDQFTTEQLAGDLLASPTLDQRIATGFHRNHPVTNETGAIDEEYRVEYVADRVDTTGAVWLGLTLGCARCHDHKYDPISQREYYRLFAFFNNGPEKGVVTEKSPLPVLSIVTAGEQQELAALKQQRDVAEKTVQALLQQIQPDLPRWRVEALAAREAPEPPRPGLHLEFGGGLKNSQADRGHARAAGELKYEPGILGTSIELTGTQHVEVPDPAVLPLDRPWTVSLWYRSGEASLGCLVSRIEPTDRRRGFELLWKKGRLVANLVNHWGQRMLSVASDSPLPLRQWQHVTLVWDASGNADGFRIYANGQPLAVSREHDSLSGSIENAEPLRIGRRDTGLGWYGRLDEVRVFPSALAEAEVARLFERDLLQHLSDTDPAQYSAAHQEWQIERHLTDQRLDTGLAAWREARRLRALVASREAESPTTLVMQDLETPRQTFVLERGQYDHPAEPVTPGVPDCLPPFPADAPANRLGLARWLIDGRNPLTARVVANRAWQHFFGDGLVRTPADFGSQGEWPSHPEVLDDLARQFVDSGWDVKALHRRIVLSDTYRRSSRATAEQLSRDPANRWLARGPRIRLSGEALRDQALLISGLLVERLGGPSVRPYQPPGLWEAVSYDSEMSYQQDSGAGLYRRTMYSFWKRQAPPPAQLLFDGPSRETCSVRRQRTNTPLQALVLLNDPTYLEASRSLATLGLKASNASGAGMDDAARVRWMVRRVTGRAPEDGEISRLLRLIDAQRKEFRSDPAAAEQLLSVGELPADAALEPAELAAWTTLASVLFNLDETLTRP